MGIHPATMTGVLTRLEKAGWLVRRRDVGDRRSVQVEPSGFDRLTALYRDAHERLDMIAAELTPEAGDVILDYLGRVCDAVRGAVDPKRRAVVTRVVSISDPGHCEAHL